MGCVCKCCRWTSTSSRSRRRSCSILLHLIRYSKPCGALGLGSRITKEINSTRKALGPPPVRAEIGQVARVGASLGVRDEALRVAAGLGGRSPWRSHPDDRPLAARFRQELREQHGCGRSDHALDALALRAYSEASSQRGWARKRALRDWCASALERGPARGRVVPSQTTGRRAQRSRLRVLRHATVGTGVLARRASSYCRRAVPKIGEDRKTVPKIRRDVGREHRHGRASAGTAVSAADADRFPERAFLHPTSSCHAERSWPSPWAVYGECVETHRVSIRDCGEAAPYAGPALRRARRSARPVEEQGSIVVQMVGSPPGRTRASGRWLPFVEGHRRTSTGCSPGPRRQGRAIQDQSSIKRASMPKKLRPRGPQWNLLGHMILRPLHTTGGWRVLPSRDSAGFGEFAA